MNNPIRRLDYCSAFTIEQSGQRVRASTAPGVEKSSPIGTCSAGLSAFVSLIKIAQARFMINLVLHLRGVVIPQFDRLRADLRRWGWMRSLFIRVMSILRRSIGLHLYRVNLRPLVRQSPEPYLPRGMALRIVQPEELLKAAKDPGLDIHPDFVQAALARGDMAFGAFERDRLVGYTWRTFTAAPDLDGLWFKVDRPCQYSYKAFTRPSYRGRRIHVAITYFADAYLLECGYTAEVGFSGISNFSSIAVAKFLGRRKIGYAGYLMWFGRCIAFRTPAVRRIGAGLFELH